MTKDSEHTILSNALDLVVGRQPWFTSADIAIACDIDVPIDIIDKWLNANAPTRELVRYSTPDPSQINSYTTGDFLEVWWVERALLWVSNEVETLSARELGHSMSTTFGTETWDAPPETLLGVGIELKAIARTIDVQRYAMPWSIIARSFRYVEEYLRAALNDTEVRRAIDPGAFATAWDELFVDLDRRARRVLALRFGFRGSERQTLEDIGEELDLTRERVRQIERSSLARIRRTRGRALSGLAAAHRLARQPRPLLLEGNDPPPELRLVCAVYGEKLIGETQELGLRILHRAQWVLDFETALLSDENLNHIFEERLRHGEAVALPPRVREILATIPLADATFLSTKSMEFLNNRFDSMPGKQRVYRALKHLGTASHYSDVAEICNKVWPDRPMSGQHTINNLSACEKDPNYDVAWIGRKGMYGLESQGYSRPDMDLFETAAEIVRTEFAKTSRPVSLETVWTRLHDYRQQPHKPSLVMALGFNDDVISVETYLYAPADSSLAPAPEDDARSDFDFSGTF